MGSHRRIACPMRHFNGIERFRQRADLIHLDQNGVGASRFDSLLQIFHIRNKQIIPHQLAAVSYPVRQHLPAVPIILRHSVFYGIDGILRNQLFQIPDLLGRSASGPFHSLEFRIIVYPLPVKFRSRAIQPDHNIFSRLISGLFDGCENGLQSIFRSVQGRCETSFIPDSGTQSPVMQHFFQNMENFRTGAKSFSERTGAYRTYHELLKSDRSIGMGTSVDNIHHRNRQDLRIASSDITVQRNLQSSRCGFCTSQRHSQHGIGAQIVFRPGTAQFYQHPIYGRLIQRIHSQKRIRNDRIDIFNGFQHAFSHIPRLIPVTQFQSLVFARRGSGRYGRPSEGTGFEHYVHFNSGISTGIQYFPSCDFYYMRHNFDFSGLTQKR